MARSLKPNQNMSRLRRFAMNHLGVKMTDEMDSTRIYRDSVLDVFDAYYENRQYDHLQNWEEARAQADYVPIRQRRPRVIYNVGKTIIDKVAAKLVGSSTFPSFVIEEDDEDTAFFRTVIKATKFRRALIKPVKNMLKSGATFVRFFLVNGVAKIECFPSKYCYPVFDQVGELKQIEVKYLYEDWQDLDHNKSPKVKWYGLMLTPTVDILYDNPEYRPGSTPAFNEVARAAHGLGWVQGEWFVTDDDKFHFDGVSLIGDILDFIDELNYSLSQSSQATSYNQEPQMTVNGLGEDEVDRLIRSSEKAWNLGREGKAQYAETNMEGVKTAGEFRDKVRGYMLDVARIVLQDPEKMAAQAQSGRALEILNAPLVELIDELRSVIEPHLVNLLIKLALTMLHCNAQGQDTMIVTPAGYVPSSFDITVQWPLIFPPTVDDISKMSMAAGQLSVNKLISRESLTRWIAQAIPSIDNVEEELQKIESEPVFSPFGGFGDQEGQDGGGQ